MHDETTLFDSGFRERNEVLVVSLTALCCIKSRWVCWTPLLAAADRGHTECVRLLLDHAERIHRDQYDRNATYLSAEAGHAQVLRELLQWSDVELDPSTGSRGLSPLEIALRNANEEAAMVLIPYSDINRICPTGDRPLNLAAKSMSLEAIQQLLAQRGIHVNAKGSGGRTVLHTAAMSEDKKMIELALTHPDIDVNIRDNDGNTPLTFTIFKALLSGQLGASYSITIKT
jgi:ankyrin repeat protein